MSHSTHVGATPIYITVSVYYRLMVPVVGLVEQIANGRRSHQEQERVEQIAMNAVMEAERSLGREPTDVSATKGLGHDLESLCEDGSLVFIEVKGRAKGADQVTLTTNEIRRANNVPEQFRLAIVLVENDAGSEPVYVRDFDFGEPGFAQIGSSYGLSTLLQHGGPPE